MTRSLQLTLLTAGITVLAAVLFLLSTPSTQVQGSTINLGPFLQVATTSTSVSVTSSVRIMATTTNPLDPANSYNRIYATICNPNANPVYINMDGDKPATLSSATYVIAAAAGYQACYEIDDHNPYSGSITASSTIQTATTITVKQYVSQ